jgi:hypothetical protein
MAVLVYKKNYDQSSNSLHIPYQDYIKENDTTLAIENFSESSVMQSVPSDQAKPICSSISLWEKDVTNTEKIVLAATDCEEVTVENGDLRSARGFNNEGKLYRLQLKDGKWTVVDYDERDFAGMGTTKQWISDYLNLVPAGSKNNLDKTFLEAKLVKKAGEAFNLTTPAYSFNFCSKDADCNLGELCFLHNANNGYGSNKCVKKCSTQAECGIGYTCRNQCVRGENQCPNSLVGVCTPDLLDINLDKTGKPF